MKISDLFYEALDAIAGQRLRTLLTMLGTVLGVASFIAIVGLGATADGQIAKGFSELQATHIEVVDIETKNANGTPGYNFLEDSEARLTKLNGVKHAGVYFQIDTSKGAENVSSLNVAKRPAVDSLENMGTSLTLFAADGGAISAAGGTVKSGVNLNSSFNKIRANAVLLGYLAAEKLGISYAGSRQTVFIDNRAYAVVGILDEFTDILPELNSAIVLPTQTALEQFGMPNSQNAAQMAVETELGAASLISVQAPLALRPDNPALLESTKPPDWSIATEAATNAMSSMLLLLSVIALFIGGVAITNTTLVSVLERRGEIGLRLALGARRTNICFQFLLESAFIGAIGATIGNVFGIGAILIGSIVNGWTPVIEPLWIFLAPLVGILVGILAGLYPAFQATKVAPARALASNTSL
ncbi:MAG: ABC transporter permease [Bifidobacteriaceae bacterium]|jgi:putative ABC transport system permease protein|nr:ABC transporter permease [Bifidobacteriaceae bacterium]